MKSVGVSNSARGHITSPVQLSATGDSIPFNQSLRSCSHRLSMYKTQTLRCRSQLEHDGLHSQLELSVKQKDAIVGVEKKHKILGGNSKSVG